MTHTSHATDGQKKYTDHDKNLQRIKYHKQNLPVYSENSSEMPSLFFN